MIFQSETTYLDVSLSYVDPWVWLTVLLFWIYFSSPSNCSTVAFPPLGSYGHIVVSVFIESLSKSKIDAPFHNTAYDYCCVHWDGLHDYLKDVAWEDIFNLGASAASAKFAE